MPDMVKQVYCYNCSQELPLNEYYNIFYGADNNICRALCTAMYSIHAHNKQEPIVFHVISDGFAKENLAKFEEFANSYGIKLIIYIIEPGSLKNLRTSSHLPMATYFRFIGPEVIKADKLLYLDTDIFASNAQLKELFATNLEDKLAGAVMDAGWMVKKRSKILALKEEKYFNAGVLLLNVKLWNEYGVFAKVMTDLSNNRKKYTYFDQDALNKILEGRIMYLPSKWNCYDVTKVQDGFVGLVHFTAHPKPWTIAWSYRQGISSYAISLYAGYEACTPWKNAAPEEPKGAHVMRIYARMLWQAGEYGQWAVWYGKYLKAKFWL